MTDRPANLFTRDDTFFGVCEALGEDFGIHANWLRLAFAAGFFASPPGAVALYLALGLVVMATRWLAPAPAPVPLVETATEAETEVAEPLPLAA